MAQIQLPQRFKTKLAATLGAGSIAIAAAFLGGLSGESDTGLEGLRNNPYYDQGGVKTVCFGHTGADIQNRYYSTEECRKILSADLQITKKQIDPYIKVGIPVTTRAAIYSFAFNVGTNAVKNSTMLRKLNAGDRAGACAALQSWIYIKKQKNQGLVNRRVIEEGLCEYDASK